MKIQRWGWYSLIVNVVLVGIDSAVAFVSGSLAVKAEVAHNFVDMLTAIAVLVGLNLANRKTKKFPYGLYKIENVVSVVLAIAIFLTAYEIGRRALVGAAPELNVTPFALAGLGVALAVAVGFSYFELKKGRQANSPALVADAKEYRVHVFTTGFLLASLVGHKIGYNLDRIAALAVVIVIAKVGWELLVSAMRVLLDASLDPATLSKIEQMIKTEPTVTELKWLTGRSAGRVRFVEAEIALRVHDLEKAETVTSQIQDKIRSAVPFIERVLIHAEPRPRTHLKYAAALADESGKLSEHFGEAPFFVLASVRLKDRKVEQQTQVANPHLDVEKAKGIRVAEWLVSQKVDCVLLKKSVKGKGPEYVFSNANVQMEHTDADTVSQALAEVTSGGGEQKNAEE